MWELKATYKALDSTWQQYWSFSLLILKMA